MSTATVYLRAKPDEVSVNSTKHGVSVRIGDSYLFVHDETGETTLHALYRWCRNLEMQTEGLMLARDDAQEARDVA